MYAEQITEKLAGNSVLEINPAVTWMLTSGNLWNNKSAEMWLVRLAGGFLQKDSLFTMTQFKKKKVLESVVTLDRVNSPESTQHRNHERFNLFCFLLLPVTGYKINILECYPVFL